MKRVSAILLSLLVVALLCSRAMPLRAADEPYDFYAVLEMTGPAAFLGQGEAQTLKALETYVNAHGGIRGRPLRIIIQDDQSNAAVAVSVVNQIIAKNVPAFIGPGFGAPCTAALPLIVTTGPVVLHLEQHVPPAGSYGFVFMLTNVDQGANAPVTCTPKDFASSASVIDRHEGQDNEKGPRRPQIPRSERHEGCW